MATASPDWAGLPTEMVATVMGSLDIPDLFRAGCVCSSCAATLYSATSGATFRVRLPDPPLRSRALVGSAHGWLATADEASSDLHLVNPLSGAQVALPPVATLHHVESFLDGAAGSLVYSVQESEDDGPGEPPPVPVLYPAQKLRLFLYYKVVMSCSPAKGRHCVVLLLHRPDGELSFARVGDDRWTWITGQTLRSVRGYRDAIYNKIDGLFYVLSFDGSMITLDLGGDGSSSSSSSPVVAKDIMPLAMRWDDPIKDLMLTPSGDVLQVWRSKEIERFDTPVELPAGVAHEFDDPYLASRLDSFIHKVDIDKQHRELLTSMGDHALFLGYNSAVCLSTKDFPRLSPDSAYVANVFDEEMWGNKHNLREIGIWDFKTETLRGLGEVQSRNPQ
ncbi:hypothetical protein SORBI_3005G168900 [Sorghum bicolor]|uniref:KIB1-4 beta-propeller domain-containing protein n=1 Tax=Sorghum bicolor TaxID=4558 RepID=C5Y5D0_SORBI|nr:hypothetical protein SORBI_3005G168900 [Sorghum bicolor]